MTNYHASALREEAQHLATVEQNFAKLTRQFADRYGARLRTAFDLMEFIEEMGDASYNEVQEYGGFELTWDRDTRQVTGIWMYSNVPMSQILDGDHRHEHGMSFDDFSDQWAIWHRQKCRERDIIQARIDLETLEAAQRAEEATERTERAEYERLKEKFGIGE